MSKRVQKDVSWAYAKAHILVGTFDAHERCFPKGKAKFQEKLSREIYTILEGIIARRKK